MKRIIAATNYGGAYDIDPYQYFTFDDLLDFGDRVAKAATEALGTDIRLQDIYIVDYSRVVVELIDYEDETEYTGQADIDMRRIRKPSDINKYIDDIIKDMDFIEYGL